MAISITQTSPFSQGFPSNPVHNTGSSNSGNVSAVVVDRAAMSTTGGLLSAHIAGHEIGGTPEFYQPETKTQSVSKKSGFGLASLVLCFLALLLIFKRK